jgi:diguanylate cyclase (GGDEF)-like protein
MSDPEADASAHILSQLQDQLRELRARLHSLQHRISEPVGNSPRRLARLLIQANEQLVLSALDAQATAERAVANLDRLARLSQRDVLTDTPNRALLLDRLESALSMAHRRGTRAAVIFLDIDNFKTINDTLGHAMGDAVLQLVAHRLKAAVRDSDAVGRHGGDEFLVLLEEVSKMTDAARIVGKIVSDVTAPSLVSGHVVHVSISAGVAIFPDDARDARTLIGFADTAMYRSKRCGGGSFSFFCDTHVSAGH